MRIVHIITGLGLGGAEGALFRLIGAMRGAEQVVISLTDAGVYGPRIAALGIAVHTIGMRPGRVSPAGLLRLVRLLRRLRPDIVQTWMYHADLIGGLAARAAQVPALVWSIRHGNIDPALNKTAMMRVMRVCARLSRWLPRRVISVSHAARDAHVAAGYDASRMVVIPNGIDCERFRFDARARARLRAAWRIDPAVPVVGLFARWNPHKDHAGFIAAIALLHARLPHVKYVLAGTGIDEHNVSLREALAAHGLHAGVPPVIGAPTRAPEVLLLGEIADMPAALSAVDILALSSRGEAFPNVVAEAMSCERTCVVTDVGDCAEIVGAFGHVARAGDPAQFARALGEALALAPDARATRERDARASVIERYSLAAVCERYHALYRALMPARRG